MSIMDEKKNKLSKGSVEGQALVIFGANGDLSNRKLLPAIFQLHIDGLLPEKFLVIGCGSDEKDEKTFRKEVGERLQIFAKENVESNPDKFATFSQMLYYRTVNNKKKEDFEALKKYAYTLTAKAGVPPNFIYYFCQVNSL